MKEKFKRFMAGRYGVDQLGRCIVIISLILIVISTFTRSSIAYFIATVLLLITYIRMFSRNHNKRYQENMKFLKLTGGMRGFFYRQKTMLVQRKTHHIYSCPSCKQKIRIPKGKGRISITCPKCKVEFFKKS